MSLSTPLPVRRLDPLPGLVSCVVYMISSVLLLSECFTLAYADEKGSCSAVKVFVRTIQASRPVEGDAQASGNNVELNLDGQLSDLRSKLEQLPFSAFKLIAQKEQQLSLREKNVLHLPNGQSLAFRPMYMDRKRVGLWLSWKDDGGTDILNTRIHFDSDDSVLTGTDSSQDTGLILAIKAVPVVDGQ